MDRNHYRALKETAALVPRLDRGRIAVTGADRADYLQGLLTNDIAALAEGRGCYAAYLTPQGRIVADAELFNVGDQLLLDVHGSVKDMLVERFTELVFTEDVTVADWTQGWVGYGISGPTAERCLVQALARTSRPGEREVIPATFDDHVCRRLSMDGASLVVSRTDPFGGKGFDLWIERAAAPGLRSALLESGCTEVAAAETDVIRIEHGRPAFPTDLNAETIPLEAGIEDRAVSFTKGCYVGQEVIVRVLHRGQGRVSRRLTGLAMRELVEPTPAVTAGAALWHEDDSAGEITSVGFSPAAGSVIGLGYVKREWLEPGTVLAVDAGSRRVQAVVTTLPFFES
jgi:folate-binding protein YgfZ